MHTESMMFDAQHQVAPAAESLKCADCHAADGRMNFAELGYSEERATELVALGGGLVEEVAGAAVEAPAEMPKTGGAPVLPAWMVVVPTGMAAVAAGATLRRFRD